MTDRPEALRLADILQHRLPSIECLEQAAAELRRLHELADKYKWQVRDTCARAEKAEAVNQELLEALKKFVAWSEAENNHEGTTFWGRVEMLRDLDAAAQAAIAKAEGRDD
jgi:hypothetical protein